MEKRTNIFEPTSCLTDEQLLRYARNEMNAESKRIVELHLADCDMCSDAVEGLTMMNPAELKSIQTGMNEQIDVLTIKRTGKIISIQRRWYMSAAAVVLLTIGTWFIFKNIQSQKNQSTVSEQYKPVQSDSNIQLQTITSQASQGVEADSVSFEQQLNVPQKNGFVIAEKPVIKKNENVVAEDLSLTKALEKKSDADEEVNAPPTIAANVEPDDKANKDLNAKADSIVTFDSNKQPGVAMNEIAVNSYRTESKKMKSITTAPGATNAGLADNSFTPAPAIDNTLYNIAVQLYNQKDYNKALTNFNQLLIQNPQHLGSNYYAGMCNYYLNNFSLAAQQLDIASSNKVTEFYESALWFKANAYIRINDKKRAKRALESVVKFNGNYKQSAEELLHTLK